MTERSSFAERVPSLRIASALDRHSNGSTRRICVAWFLFAQIALVLTGCASFQGIRDYLDYNDTTNDFVMGWRNQAWAIGAWHRHAADFACEPQLASFREGFRDGYMAVASGGDGCVPPMPPRRYWTWRYQSLEGQAKVAAWYAGYPYGAAAAKEDGAGNFQEIQVSNLIDAQYSPEFQNGICPCEQDGVYPEWFPPEYLPPEQQVLPHRAPNELPPGASGPGQPITDPNQGAFRRPASTHPSAFAVEGPIHGLGSHSATANQPAVYVIPPPFSRTAVKSGMHGSDILPASGTMAIESVRQ